MKIASMEDPFPRGVVIGKQITGPRLSEAEHSRKCGYVEVRAGLARRSPRPAATSGVRSGAVAHHNRVRPNSLSMARRWYLFCSAKLTRYSIGKGVA